MRALPLPIKLWKLRSSWVPCNVLYTSSQVVCLLLDLPGGEGVASRWRQGTRLSLPLGLPSLGQRGPFVRGQAPEEEGRALIPPLQAASHEARKGEGCRRLSSLPGGPAIVRWLAAIMNMSPCARESCNGNTSEMHGILDLVHPPPTLQAKEQTDEPRGGGTRFRAQVGLLFPRLQFMHPQHSWLSFGSLGLCTVPISLQRRRAALGVFCSLLSCRRASPLPQLVFQDLSSCVCGDRGPWLQTFQHSRVLATSLHGLGTDHQAAF